MARPVEEEETATQAEDTRTEESYQREAYQYEYVSMQIRALRAEQVQLDADLRRLKVTLVLLVYVAVFAYLVGRDNARNHGS